MKKAFKSKVVVLAALFILLVLAFSFIAYAGTKNSNTCLEPRNCVKAESNGEMLWDIFSRQFVSAVHIQ